MVIQAKQYRGQVGSPKVRDLVGAKQVRDADMAVLVTSSNFSSHAERTADRVGVELVTGRELKHRLNESNVEPPELNYW